MKRSLQQIADAIGARVIGNGLIELDSVASLQSARETDLIFVEDEKYLHPALDSHAGAIIAGKFAASADTNRPLLISDHPKLAFARAARLLSEGLGSDSLPPPSVHATAVIHPTAMLGDGVRIEARVVIGERVRIGQATRVGAGCAIAAGVIVGESCEIYPNVTIYSGTTLSDRIIVHAGAVLGSDGFGYVRDRQTGRYEKFPQVGKLIIEDEVEIGANATIDRGALDETRIRRGTKIDNLVHVGHNCQIGEDVVIAAQTGVSGSAVIEDDVVIGGQVGIADHVRIKEAAILGAQCGVPSNKVIRGKGVLFWGTPARPIKEYLKQLAALAQLAKKDTGGS